MSIEYATGSRIGFDDPRLGAALDALSGTPEAYDALDFGLVVMDLDGTVLYYNVAEARLSGIQAERVVGLTFFSDVAPCTNNFLVSGRFEEEPVLDETIEYVFTVKMRPKPVRLRMLKDDRSGRQYLAVKW
jgi:photoactive yellow protein